MTPDPEKPRRRPRYSGRNPRRFEEKYKEHHPERYASEVDKISASGKTPAGTHRPIMLEEILQLLDPRPGHTALDCTLGYGGHARRLWEAVQPGGHLLAMDVDPIELPKTEARLRTLPFPSGSLLIRRMNFAGCSKLLAEAGLGPANVILADLGLSSMQIDNPSRGFTFKREGPLDLRMNPQKGHPASALLATIDVSTLENLLQQNSDEPLAHILAPSLCAAAPRLLTTTSLASHVRLCPRADEHTVRRVFQALRIAVNDEFSTLDSFLRQLPHCLAPQGRAAILTFHSGEDRRVKQAFRSGLQEGRYSKISEEVLRPSPEELRANLRSSSAKLRWAQLA
jgi:16S rRNA (cytosine1402-N4)-methyltransferase